MVLPFFLIGCAQKTPITWEKRVIKSKVKPVELSYHEYGKENSETILFLHGFGESQHTWRFLLDDLSKEYHLITLDLKGFGESPKTEDSDYSVYDQAQLVQQFIKKHKLNNITIVGRSFGGGVALVLALMQEEKLIDNRIKKMVLINSMSYQQRLPSMMRILQKPIIGYLGIHLLSANWIATKAYQFSFSNNELIPQSSIRYAAQMLSLPLAKYAYLKTVNSIIPDDILKMQKRYKNIKIPTLILWGEDDVSIRIRMAYRLHRALPNSQLKILKGIGHMPQEEKPKVVIDAIRTFMEVR